MKRFSAPSNSLGPPPRRSRPRLVSTAEGVTGPSSKGYTATSLDGRILDGWKGRADDTTLHASMDSEGLVVLAVDVTASMTNEKGILTNYLSALGHTLSVVSNGLTMAVVFYTDFDGNRSEPVVWSPFSMGWSGEDIAEAIRQERCGYGGGTSCEAFDVAFLYIINDLVPVYRKLVVNGDSKATIVFNFTDEDMRTYCEHTCEYGRTLSAKSKTYLNPETENTSSASYTVSIDDALTCTKAKQEIIKRWGGMVSKDDILELCYDRDVFLRIFRFDRGNTVYGYQKLCDDTMDRFELFRFYASDSLNNVPGMLCAIAYRFFAKIEQSMSSSYLLAKHQDLINKLRITASSLDVFVERVGAQATAAQIEDLADRTLNSESRQRQGIGQYNNAKHTFNGHMADIFLSSFVDRHMFAGTRGEIFTEPKDVGEVDRSYRQLATDGHTASILANMFAKGQTHDDIIAYLENKDERVKPGNCCKNCANHNQPGTAKQALARWFALKIFEGLAPDRLRMECALALPDVVGSIYKFVCSNAPKKCATIGQLLTHFMSLNNDLTRMIRKCKHNKDQNMDIVSRFNKAIVEGGTIQDAEFWFYLDNVDQLRAWADAELEKATGGDVDVYKRFEHPLCFEVVRRTVTQHLKVVKGPNPPSAVVGIGKAPSDRLLALPVTLTANERDEDEDGDCMFFGEEELSAFSAEKALPLIMSLVGKNQSVSNPMLNSGLKCVATIATAITGDDVRTAMLKNVLLRMSATYLGEVYSRAPSRDVFSLVFDDEGYVVRDNLTNWETLYTLNKWAAALKKSKRDIVLLPNAIKAYGVLVNVKKSEFFDNIHSREINVIEIADEQMAQCKACLNACLRSTDMANSDYCSWCFSPQEGGKERFNELLRKSGMDIEYRKERSPLENTEAGRMNEWRIAIHRADNDEVVNLMAEGKEEEVLTEHLDRGRFVSMDTARNVFKKIFKGCPVAEIPTQYAIEERTSKDGSVKGQVVVFPEPPQRKCGTCGRICPGKWLVKKSKCDVCMNIDRKGRNPGSVVKWAIYPTHVHGYTKLTDLERGLLSFNASKRKAVARTILKECLDKGVPVSMATAGKVMKCLFAKTMLSTEAVKYLERKISANKNSTVNADSTSTVSLPPFLQLRCSVCREDYKGSWFSPSKASGHVCPSCRCASRLSEDVIETILANGQSLGFTSTNEMVWFLFNIKNKGLQRFQKRVSPALANIKMNDTKTFAAAEGVDIADATSPSPAPPAPVDESLAGIMTSIAGIDVGERGEDVRYVSGSLWRGEDRVRLPGMDDYGKIDLNNPARKGEKIDAAELKWSNVAKVIGELIGGPNPMATAASITKFWNSVPRVRCASNTTVWLAAHEVAKGFSTGHGDADDIRVHYTTVNKAFLDMFESM